MSDDNKTIVHHKVAAKVFIVMNAEDALASSRFVQLESRFNDRN